jgi:hypothetical protein
VAFYLLFLPLVVFCYFNVIYYKRVRSGSELCGGPSGRDAELGAMLALAAVSNTPSTPMVSLSADAGAVFLSGLIAFSSSDQLRNFLEFRLVLVATDNTDRPSRPA